MEAQGFHNGCRCRFEVVASRVPFSEVDTDEPVFPFSATTVPSFGITDGEQHRHRSRNGGYLQVILREPLMG